MYNSCMTAAAAAVEDIAAQEHKLKAYLTYKEVYRQCQEHFKPKRGALLPLVDPHANTLQATYSLDEYIKIVQHGTASSSCLDARDLSMFISQTQMVGRSDDTRTRMVCELYEPYARKCIGGCGLVTLQHPQ